MGRNNFREDLQMSYESCQLAIDEKTLKNYFKFAESVEKTESDEDKTGIDYYVNLRGGKKIGVDVKTRRRGTAKYWKNGCPELVIELWSQAYSSRFDERNKIGWTIDYKKRCQYIMYKFDAEECDKVFIFPFEQLLITTYKYMQGMGWKIWTAQCPAGQRRLSYSVCLRPGGCRYRGGKERIYHEIKSTLTTGPWSPRTVHESSTAAAA